MESSTLFNASLVCYLVASVVYIAHLSFRAGKVGMAATAVTVVGFAAQTAALGMRWYEKTRLTGFGNIPPLSNMYESMVFWSWSIILIYLVFERIYRNRALGVIAAPLASSRSRRSRSRRTSPRRSSRSSRPSRATGWPLT